MLDSAYDGVEFNFIGRIITFRAAKGPREDARWVLKASVFEPLHEDSTKGDAAAFGLENETAVGIGKAHEAWLQKLLLESLKTRLEGGRPFNEVGP